MVALYPLLLLCLLYCIDNLLDLVFPALPPTKDIFPPFSNASVSSSHNTHLTSSSSLFSLTLIFHSPTLFPLTLIIHCHAYLQNRYTSSLAFLYFTTSSQFNFAPSFCLWAVDDPYKASQMATSSLFLSPVTPTSNT